MQQPGYVNPNMMHSMEYQAAYQVRLCLCESTLLCSLQYCTENRVEQDFNELLHPWALSYALGLQL